MAEIQTKGFLRGVHDNRLWLTFALP